MIISKVKGLMEKAGVTYMELERATGLSNQTISRARGEAIRECSLATLEAIASALGVMIADLFEEVRQKQFAGQRLNPIPSRLDPPDVRRAGKKRSAPSF